MARTPSRACDSCGSTMDVNDVVVAYRFEDALPWMVDLCEVCYRRRFGDLLEVARPAPRTNIRPQYRFTITEITEDNL